MLLIPTAGRRGWKRRCVDGVAELVFYELQSQLTLIGFISWCGTSECINSAFQGGVTSTSPGRL